MVVLRFLWPKINWQMCGGSPFCSASVVKILLMSWGVKVSGSPVLTVRPATDAVLQQQRRRRVPHALERIVGRDQRDGADVMVADPGDDDGEDLDEFGGD